MIPIRDRELRTMSELSGALERKFKHGRGHTELYPHVKVRALLWALDRAGLTNYVFDALKRRNT